MGAGVIRLKRQVYSAVLAAGLLALLWLVLRDAERVMVASVGSAGPSPAALTPLTGGAVLDGYGSWSPDGREIAFMRTGQVWLISASGGEPRAVTQQEGFWDTVPVWHPKGGDIALIRLEPETDQARVMLVNVRTGSERELVHEKEPIGHLAWGPDGTHLYYTTSTRLMRLDVGRRRADTVLELSSDWEMLAGGLAVSRDGRTAIFGAGPRTERGSVRYDLWRLPLDGGAAEPEQLTREGGIMPTLDSTGRRLIYRRPREETGIYLMDLERHTTRQVVADEGGALYFHPRFSPDGKRLLVSRLLLKGAEHTSGTDRFTSHLYLSQLAAEAE